MKTKGPKDSPLPTANPDPPSDIAEEPPRECPDFFKSLLNALDDPVFVKDENHRWVFLNQKSCEMMGRPAQELLGKSDYDLFPAEQADIFWEMDSQVLETETPNLNIEEITWQGRQHTIATKKSIFKNPASGRRFVVGSIHNITDSQQTEQALVESETRFRELAEMLPQTVFEMDLTGRLTFVNKNAYHMFGYTPEEFELGLNAFEMIAPEDRARAEANTKNIISGQKVEYQEYAAQRKDGFRFPAIILSALMKRDDQPCGLRGLIIDITHQVNAKEELEREVKTRTADLESINAQLHREIKERRSAEKDLHEKSQHLAEVNTALKVLLDRNQKNKDDISETILSNIKSLVLPYLEKLKKTALKPSQQTFVGIIESNLAQVISPFMGKYSLQFHNLTPMEIQVANLVKIGKTNKEMAAILNLSLSTVLTHRHHIRAKLGLKNKKINLRSYLGSLG